MVHALIPGSFDPLTCGHSDIVRKTARIFDQVTVAVVCNPNKRAFLPLQVREELLREEFFTIDNIRVETCVGLLVHYARDCGADVLVKGLRSSIDFSYELPMDHMNQHLAHIPTMYLATAPQYSYVSSSLVREVAILGGDITDLVPAHVAQALLHYINDVNDIQ